MEPDKKFAKGFNAGYQLAIHNPELSKKLMKGIQKNEAPLVQGFFAGTYEYSKEKLRQRITNHSKERKRDDRDGGRER